MSAKRPDIVIFMRKKRMGDNSIEEIFNTLTPLMGEQVTIKTLPHDSGSPIGFLKNLLFAWQNRGKVNHIAGEVHYLALILPNCIVTFHDIGSICTGHNLKSLIRKWLWVSWPIIAAKRITAISRATLEEITDVNTSAERKSIIVHNPIRNIGRHSKGGQPSQKTIILHQGTKPHKNLERVLAAIEGLEAKLLILGPMTKGQKQLAESKLIDYKYFYDLTYEEVMELYGKSDIVSFPSLYEGFGMPVIEGQMAMRPVVTSDIPVLHEVAGDGALFVNPNSTEEIREAFQTLIDDRTLRDDLVRKGAENIRRFDPHAIAAKYMAIYNELLNESK